MIPEGLRQRARDRWSGAMLGLLLVCGLAPLARTGVVARVESLGVLPAGWVDGAALRPALALHLIALPAAALALARRFGRGPWAILAVVPLAWSAPLARGQLGFCFAVPCALGALAELDQGLELCSTGWLALALALLGGAWALDPGVGVFATVGSLVVTAAHARRRAAYAGIVGLGVLVGSAAIALSLRRVVVSRVVGFAPERPIDAATLLPARLLAGIPGDGDERCLLLLALGWVLLAATAPAGQERRPTLRDLVPEILFALAVLGYLALPGGGAVPIAPRMAALAAVVGTMLPRGEVTGRRRWLAAPLVLAGVIYPILLASTATGVKP